MTSVPNAGLETPLEKGGYEILPKAAVITEFLNAVAERYDCASCFEAGRSHDTRPITAVLLSSDPAFLRTHHAASRKLTVFLNGSLHGDEASGCEALLLLVRNIAQGCFSELLKQINFLCVPLSNPDGRDMSRRGNGDGVNLNIDFLLQSQPETRVLTGLLHEFRPEVLLDVHETPAFKKGLARAGFQSGFDAQLDVPNNPNIDPGLLRFAEGKLLPNLLRRINEKGLGATRYYGEVNRLDKIATHGGLTLRNLRNYSALRGTLSVLLENRLDPPDRDYPTPGNIRDRTDRQYAAIGAILKEILLSGEDLIAEIEDARKRIATVPADKGVVLASEFIPDDEHPTVDLPLRPLKGGAVSYRPFLYRPYIRPTLVVNQPAAFCIIAHHAVLAPLLRSHALKYGMVTAGSEVPAMVVESSDHKEADCNKERELVWTPRSVHLKPGDLIVETRQPGGIILPLIFDPRSPHCVFRGAPYSALLDREETPVVGIIEDFPPNLATP